MPGRNDPCPCGSGKKFKKCCGAASSPTSPVTPVSLATAAMHAMQAGDPVGACKYAEQAVAGGHATPALYEILGTAYYQLGDLLRALKAFQSQLVLQPDNAITHNNLCLLKTATGSWREAAEHGRQAIALQPELASAYNNLGNAYKQGNAQQQAASCYQAAIDKGYRNPGVYVNLGVVQQEQGDWPQAERSYRKALELDPEFLPAMGNLAIVLQEMHQFEEAGQLYQTMLDSHPEDTELLTQLGAYYLAQGQLEPARSHLEHALRLGPDAIGALINLGMVLEQEQDFDAACRYYQKVLHKDPGNALASYNLASILHQHGETQRAIALYRNAIKNDPNLAVAYAGIAQLLLHTNQAVAAMEYAEKALALQPRDIFINQVMAEQCVYQQRYADALKLIKKQLENYPDEARLYSSLVDVYKHSGLQDEAIKAYEKLLELAPDRMQYKLEYAEFEESRHKLQHAAELLSELEHDGFDEPRLYLLRARLLLRQNRPSESLQLLKGNDPEKFMSVRDQVEYFFMLARVCERLGQYAEAYESYTEANNIKNRMLLSTYDPEKTDEYYARIKYIFCKEFAGNVLPAQQTAEETAITPVFIVGFPRSGTTLLEQIIAMHPEVIAGGEMVFIQELVSTEASRILGGDKVYPDFLLEGSEPIKQPELQKLRDFYLAAVEQSLELPPGKRMVTDKMPLNVVNLGIISLLFPESPILNIVRHPLDVCLSNYAADFAHGNRHTASLELCARYYASVFDLSRHYKTTLHMNYLELRYEDLIADQEKYTRKVIDFIGLPWDEQCLNFHESTRVANTASYAQVTQKIYNTSKYRYKRYYTQLQPLVPILQEAIDYYGYTVGP